MNRSNRILIAVVSVIAILGVGFFFLQSQGVNVFDYSPQPSPEVSQEELSEQAGQEASASESNTDSSQQTSSQKSETSTSSQSVVTHTLTMTAPKDGQTVFELLKEKADILYKEYDFGVFIEEIDGTKADSDNFWAFYVNDELANVGADQFELKEGDIVRWSFEAIKTD